MSFTPDQVGRMSLYQFSACVDGFNRANGDKPRPPTDEEYYASLRELGDLI
jgi:hypothetical protein